MKVMALNLHSYQEEHQLDKFQKIADKIIDEKIDVICFSEASQRINSAYITDYLREDNAIKLICDMVNQKAEKVYQYAWEFSHYGFTIYEEGIGIITSMPIESIECRYISKTNDPFSFKSRKVMKVILKDEEESVQLFSVHLGWGDDEQEPFEYQVEQLDLWVNENNQLPTIIAGDFSNDYHTCYYDMVVNRNYIDQYLQANPEGMNDYTFINPSGIEFRNSQKLRLDYVFTINDTYKASNAKRFFLEDDSVSDHAAIYIELN